MATLIEGNVSEPIEFYSYPVLYNRVFIIMFVSAYIRIAENFKNFAYVPAYIMFSVVGLKCGAIDPRNNDSTLTRCFENLKMLPTFFR